MNARQTVVAVLGAVFVVALALFPPRWGMRMAPSPADGGELDANVRMEPATRSFAGFRWFASDARADDEVAGAAPDYPAAISMQLAVLALSGAAMVALGRRPPAHAGDVVFE